jgi:GMP synthase-like glutamine amidotransferase
VVDCYTEAGRLNITNAGAVLASELHRTSLRRAAEAGCSRGRPIEFETIFPADTVNQLPTVEDLRRFDGISWTGSSLTITDDQPEVNRQKELARRSIESKVPVFGTCWGLQISAAVAGAKCESNVFGREQGIARSMQASNHPM